MNILDEILAHKAEEVRGAKTRQRADVLSRSAREVRRPVAGLCAALRACSGVAVIAEIKRRSPSKGLIRADFDAEKIALAYQAAGAAAISVLTDEKFFGGSLEILRQVRAAVTTPLLRKDFIIDRYQIDEARVAGADAVLLIVAALSDADLADFHEYASGLGLDVLVEVHDEAELERALAIGSKLIGVNNRDLKSFQVDLGTTERLAARIADPGVLLVAESGIGCPADVARLARAGARGFLVGESLMRMPDPGNALVALRRPT